MSASVGHDAPVVSGIGSHATHSIDRKAAPEEVTLAWLAGWRRWVAWQVQDRKGGPSKVPHPPSGGGFAKSDNPKTWGLRKEAEAKAKVLPMPYKMGGVGLMLGELREPSGIALGGVDLDACLSDGTMAPWARAVVDRFGTYAEVSPSGTGIKLFFTYSLTDLPKMKEVMGTEGGKKWSAVTGADHPPAIELYLTGRYFAVTDKPIPDSPMALRMMPFEVLEWLIRDHGPNAFPKAKTTGTKNTSNTSRDGSRSAAAWRRGCDLVAKGADFDGMVKGLLADPETEAWTQEKGQADGQRELRRIFAKAKAKQEEVASGPWHGRLHMGGKVPVSNLANALIALRGAPELAGLFAHDAMLRHTMVLADLPNPRMAAVTAARPLTDADVSAVQEWMQERGLLKMGRDTVHQAVGQVAHEAEFHPVRDYLNGLGWDGTPRIGKWLSYYVGAEPSPYVSAVGRMFLIAMVARVMRPGCKADYMIVLEGPQGARKSTVCAILGGDWFSDALPDLTTGKDVAVHLAGKWLIEVAELAALSKTGTELLKSFLSRDTERYRPPYGREEVIAKRQCIFIGTTNEAVYLKDGTGGRRFWPVKVGTIDTDALRHDRDQLFAEALVAYKNGEHWWPDSNFERDHIAPEQESRLASDAWEEAVGPFLETQTKVTVSGVARAALRIEADKLSRETQNRIMRVMQACGWEQGKRSNGIRWWERRSS